MKKITSLLNMLKTPEGRDKLLNGFMGKALKMSAVRALIIVLSFVGSVALTRAIGPEGRGLIAWFVAAASIAMMFAQGGMEMLNRRFTAEDKSLAGGLLTLSLKVCAVGTLLTLPFVVYAAFHSGVAHMDYGMLVLLPLLVFFMALNPPLYSLQLGLDRVNGFMWGTVIQKLGNVVLVLALIGLDLITPLLGLLAFLISYILQAAWSLYTLKDTVPERKDGALQFALSKKKYLLGTYVRNILARRGPAAVPLMLVSLHSVTAAGAFAACMIVIDAITKTFGMVSTYALPQIAGAKLKKDKQKLKKVVQQLSFWFMSAVAIFCAATAGWAIPLLLGQEFATAVPAFQILCFYMVFISLADANQSIAMAGTERLVILIPTGVMVVTVLVAGFLLIPSQGAFGGAIALAVASFTNMVASWLCLKNMDKHKEGQGDE